MHPISKMLSMLVKAGHGEGPGKLFHPLPEVSDSAAGFWVIEQEGFEILELGWKERKWSDSG